MKLTNIRHVSQDFSTSNGLSGANYLENVSIRSCNLNKNKLYKIKNLNVINSNVNNTFTNVNIACSLIFSNDEDFINNLYLGYLAQHGTPISFTYTDPNLVTTTAYPYPVPATMDIESMKTRKNSFNANSIICTHALPGNYIYTAIQNQNCFFGLLRTIPLTSIYAAPTTGNPIFNYSNFITDFSFYNNLSNKLNIFCYMSEISSSPQGFRLAGAIDFDLEEYEEE